MCGPKFCSMRISHEIRDQAGSIKSQEQIDKEMEAKSEAFRVAGGTIYVNPSTR